MHQYWEAKRGLAHEASSGLWGASEVEVQQGGFQSPGPGLSHLRDKAGDDL